MREKEAKEPELKPKIEDPKPQFKSSFKAWIRIVAFVIVAVFLPEQVAQAVEYDWRVIWRQPAATAPSIFAPSYLKDIRTIDIPLAIKNILKDISGKPVNAIQLSPNLTVTLEKPLRLSKERIEEIYNWLKGKPCGAKALYDYLTYQQGLSPSEAEGTVPAFSEQDIAVMALTVDILNDVVRPEGNPEVIKNSLYALSKTSEYFGHKLYPVKMQGLSPSEAKGAVPVPFIAHLNGDHYVLVTKISEGKVYFVSNHKEEFLPLEKFLSQFSGYALIPVVANPAQELSRSEALGILGAAGDNDSATPSFNDMVNYANSPELFIPKLCKFRQLYLRAGK
jgi:hypothetical protein